MEYATGGPTFPDPFAHGRGPLATFWHALLATALFRCWHILLFFAAWSTIVSVISHTTHNLGIASTLLTVLGTVLGFVISYRTTSSFERYNEGRRYWSQIVLSTRTMARLIWFHVPETMEMGSGMSEDEVKTRVLIEKKTVLNLIDGFCVSIKHYLRGEEGIGYVDMYHTTRYLPSYALPAGMPSNADLSGGLGSPTSSAFQHRQGATQRKSADGPTRPSVSGDSTRHDLPLPATTPGETGTNNEKAEFYDASKPPRQSHSNASHVSRTSLVDVDELLPARLPPRYSYLDLFPFSLMLKFLIRRGKQVKGKKATRLRAKLRHQAISHNLPLEISLYLSSYIAALQERKAIDAATISGLLNALNQLVDALTGLERILTTPIPYSYSIHLWSVTLVYCFFLPFQLWPTLKFLTIPGTIVSSFIFFGFLVAGEEIENPFGYDKNDLDLDHFTNGIIRKELAAITATPSPHPKDWAFTPVNNRLANPHSRDAEHVTPEEWVSRGKNGLQAALFSSS